MKIKEIERRLNEFKLNRTDFSPKRKPIKLRKSGSCFECASHAITRDGHVKITIDGKTKLMHRMSFRVFNGKIPKDLQVRHTCDNPKCVHPKHLILGVNNDNVQDRVSRKRSALGEDSGNSVLLDREVKAIYLSPLSCSMLAAKYLVGASTIKSIRSGRTWKHVTQNLRKITIRRPVGAGNASAKITEAQALKIIKSSKSANELADKYGVSARTIRKIKDGTRWGHLQR